MDRLLDRLVVASVVLILAGFLAIYSEYLQIQLDLPFGWRSEFLVPTVTEQQIGHPFTEVRFHRGVNDLARVINPYIGPGLLSLGAASLLGCFAYKLHMHFAGQPNNPR
ncbi:MAG: hypothetical protein AAFZ07_04075 [Actinomycetota bacterium]